MRRHDRQPGPSRGPDRLAPPLGSRARLALALPLCGALVGAAACERRATGPLDRPAGIAPSGVSPPAAAPSGGPPAAPPAAPTAADEVEEVPSAPDPASTIGGSIVLPAARRKDVAKGDVIFLIARRAGGGGGPGSMIAVQKLVADEFPMKFALGPRDAMIPGTKFEGALSITVRVDKDGDPMTRRKGDLLGQADAVPVGKQDVVVTLDTLQTEDTSLAPPGAALPPGHP
jgi:hypothetical protein